MYLTVKIRTVFKAIFYRIEDANSKPTIEELILSGV